MLHEFRQTVGVSGLRRINQHLVGRLLRRAGGQPYAVALMDATDLPAAQAALGGRTLKTGQSRWFVGYKKPTLRLWLPTVHPSVTLVPLVSWITPANVAEGGLLLPSLRWCRRHLGWWPGIVVADRGYLSAQSQQAGAGGLAECGGHPTARRYETPAALCERGPSGMSAGTTPGVVGV
jgi:hypothetical protein